MPELIKLPTFSDSRGDLTVIDRILPFDIKRVFFIYATKADRGGHGHKWTKMALIATSGSLEVEVQSPKENFHFKLENPNQCLLLEPEDWHEMINFTSDAVLLVLASTHFNPDDYFHEKYR